MKSAVKTAAARRLDARHEGGPDARSEGRLDASPDGPPAPASRPGVLDPVRFGGLEVAGRFFLAPLAGVSDWPFRVIARELGAPLAYTEMVSSEGLARDGAKTVKYLDRGEDERPFAVQLFGADPDTMARAAERVVALGADLVDVNMGCPVKKVVRTGAGSAMLQDPDRVEAVVRAMASAVDVPIQIKIRTGWDAHSINAVAVAQAARAGGAAAIAIHGRTRAQAYDGVADWSIISEVKRRVPELVVIGNGDIVTAEDAIDRLESAGVDAVMIGRGACGYPWIFREIRALAEGRPLPPPPDYDEWRAVIARHLDNLIRYRDGDTHRAVREFRKHLVWYSRGRRGAAAFRAELPDLHTVDDVQRCLDRHFPREAHAIDRRAELVTGPLSRAWG